MQAWLQSASKATYLWDVGGTGKRFLYNTITTVLRARTVLVMAGVDFVALMRKKVS